MTSYLTSVLEGVVDMAQVKQWISQGNGLPPATSVATSPRSPISSDQPQFTVDQFRVLLLNLVKEEADNIFLAAEQQALNSHPQLPEKLFRDAKTCHANSHPLRPPGLLNESNFPTLSIVPTKVSKTAFCNICATTSAHEQTATTCTHVCRKKLWTKG